jgi:hypothetical protein
VGTFADLAGKGISDELFGEEWIQNSVNGVMEKTVTDGGFVDVARFGVVDLEMLVLAMSIGMILEIVVKCEDVIHEMQLKLKHVLLLALTFDKLAPR